MEEFIQKLLSDNKVNGLRQCRRGIIKGQIKSVIIANDTDPEIKEKFLDLCKQKEITVYTCESKEELGTTLGLTVDCAIVGLLK